MSFAKQTHYRLSPRAFDDLDDIWRYTAEIWSLNQADTYVDRLTKVFDGIVAMPDIARERVEFDPPVRIHVYQNHLIVYVIRQDHIVILRILGSRQNWQAMLRALEP